MARIYGYTVRGSRAGAFPIDMLWHAEAWPATSIDAAMIATLIERNAAVIEALPRKVEIRMNSYQPPSGRWSSFLWEVVPEHLKG